MLHIPRSSLGMLLEQPHRITGSVTGIPRHLLRGRVETPAYHRVGSVAALFRCVWCVSICSRGYKEPPQRKEKGGDLVW